MTANNPYDKLSVGDVAETDEEERIRIYGATKDSSPFKGVKIRDLPNEDETTDSRQLQYTAQQDPLLKGNDRRPLGSGDAPLGGSTHSLSSWSSETIVSTRSFSDSDSWLKHPRVRENWKVVIGSFVLVAIGILLFLVGIAVTASPQRGLHCLIFFIIGLLCFIPGVYHVVYIYFAVQGRPGYTFYNLPVFK